MTQISQVGLVFLTVFLLFSNSLTYARILLPLQDPLVKANGTSRSISSLNMEDDDLFGRMGLEKCEKDEDCLKRRMVAEAHLDYIYTQGHKTKGSP